MFDQGGRTLTLGEGAFDKDSYHLTVEISHTLDECRPFIEEYLAAETKNQIAIEGHSDALEFRRGGVIRSAVGNIDTNYALSAMRAVEARRWLLKTFDLNEEGGRKYESKIIAAGYGASRQRLGTDGPADPRNRRVEIRFSGDDVASFQKVVEGLRSIKSIK